jgi:uncharacterized protein
MKRDALVIAGDQYHPAAVVMSGLAVAAGSDFAFELVASVPEVDTRFGAVVLAKMNVTSELDSRPWVSPDSESRLQEWVASGNGLLVVHAGTVGYSNSCGIREMTGGAFLHHPESCDVTVAPMEGHPLTAGVSKFTVRDEHYFMEYVAEGELFLASHSVHGTQPAGWTMSVGEGRVCVLTPGHFAGVWSNSDFQQLLRNSLNWVTRA